MLTRNVVRAIQWAVRLLTLGHVAVLLHECAHAAVALWNGDVVSNIVIGQGPLVGTFRRYGIIVEVRERGNVGHMVYYNVAGHPWHEFAVCLAGPFASWVWTMALCFAATKFWLLTLPFVCSAFMLSIGSQGDIEAAGFTLADALGYVTEDDRVERRIKHGSRERTILAIRKIYDRMVEKGLEVQVLAYESPRVALAHAAEVSSQDEATLRESRMIGLIADAARRHEVTWADVRSAAVNPAPAASVNSA